MNCEGLPTRSRQEFCLALKTARERSGISLAEITKTTNIPSSLFAGLEQNDLRHWPGGLFRRSFFRDYARAIGLPAEELCAEFVRLFPDEETTDLGLKPQDPSPKPQDPSPKPQDPSPKPQDPSPSWASELRLELDAAWHGPRGSFLSRLLTAAIDAGAVIVVAVALAWLADQDRPATIASVALAYFCLATPLFGESPARWIIARRRSILDAITYVAGSANAATDEPVDEAEARQWFSDARRVGPTPRLRVRFKTR